MKTKTKVLIGLGLTTVVLGSAGAAYAMDPIGARIALTETLYSSLPADVQGKYVSSKLEALPYASQSEIVKAYVDSGKMTPEDQAYTGVSSLMQLAPDKRTATIDLLLEKSDYDVQKGVTFYGLQKLTPEDTTEALKQGGEQLWNYVTKLVQEKYIEIFK